MIFDSPEKSGIVLIKDIPAAGELLAVKEQEPEKAAIPDPRRR